MPEVTRRFEVLPGVFVRCRPGTSDESVFREVVGRRTYSKPSVDFNVEAGERWLDLGANVGAFAVYCVSRGAVSVCYEPDPSNYRMLLFNLPAGCEAVRAAVTACNTNEVAFWRNHKLKGRFSPPVVSQRGSTLSFGLKREGEPIMVPNLYVGGDLGQPFDGIKMDIEGGECQILDSGLIPECEKLVLEYHMTKDKSVDNLKRRLEYLRSRFDVVSYPSEFDRICESGGRTRTFFDRLVFCHSPKRINL